MVSPEIFEKLKAKNGDTIISRLTLHAVFKTRRLYKKIGSGGLPGGREPKDIALEAIKLVLDGQRKWNPSTAPDLLEYLKGVVDSIISHLIESKDHQLRDSDPPEDIEENPRKTFDVRLPTAPDEEVIAKDFLEYLRKNIKGDETCELVLYCIEEGLSKTRDIAETMKLQVSNVNNAKRRLRRLIEKYNKE